MGQVKSHEGANIGNRDIDQLFALRSAFRVIGQFKERSSEPGLFTFMIFLSEEEDSHAFYRTMKNDK